MSKNTAIQILFEYIDNGNVKWKDLKSEDLRKFYYEKEREDIENAYNRGTTDSLNREEISGNEYYETTFNK